MADIFISYARSTAKQAQAVVGALRELGYSVWIDDELPAHRTFTRVIEEQMTAAKAAVVIWSADAVQSEWVLSEANRAREERKLVQSSTDNTRLPMPFDTIQCANLAGWSGDPAAPGWRKLIASIAALVGGVDAAALSAIDPPLPSEPAIAARPVRRASICVLPFANMSGDPEQEYFSDGISEDIITDLSKVSALSVVARHTAFTFKGKSVDVPEVAARLKVSHLLEGSVRKAGGRVRITAQLIDGVAGDHVWAERYDRDLTDIFALQDEISQAIVAALKLRLLPEEKRAIGKRGTNSAEAYDLYLMARQYRELTTDDPLRHETTVRLCERAVAIDPNYAQAWTVMGAAQMSLFYNHGRKNDAGAAAIAQAVRLDPDLGEARALRARELHRAGRREEALAELEIALRLDPDSYDVNYRAGAIYYLERRFAEAVRSFRKTIVLRESDVESPGMLLSALGALGDQVAAREAARTTLERAEKALALDLSNGQAMAHGVSALAALGQRERAREWIDRAMLLEPDNVNMRYNFACSLSLYLKDAEGALGLLETVFARDRADFVASASSDPDLDPIRDDPRFRALMAQAKARLRRRRRATGQADRPSTQ